MPWQGLKKGKNGRGEITKLLPPVFFCFFLYAIMLVLGLDLLWYKFLCRVCVSVLCLCCICVSVLCLCLCVCVVVSVFVCLCAQRM